MPSLKITNGTWEELKEAAKMIREQVFIQEQNIAAEDEWDVQDEIAVHFVVYEQYQAIATARLLQNHSIGRVAVPSWFGRGQSTDAGGDCICPTATASIFSLVLSSACASVLSGFGLYARG